MNRYVLSFAGLMISLFLFASAAAAWRRCSRNSPTRNLNSLQHFSLSGSEPFDAEGAEVHGGRRVS